MLRNGTRHLRSLRRVPCAAYPGTAEPVSGEHCAAYPGAPGAVVPGPDDLGRADPGAAALGKAGPCAAAFGKDATLLRETRRSPGPQRGASAEFLLAAVSYRFGEEVDAERLQRICRRISPAESRALGESAAYHELESLLHLICEDCSSLGLDLPLADESKEEWRSVHFREAARSTLIHHVAAKTLPALAGAGIRVIPLKGYYLSARYYDRKGARTFRDLDILVEEDALVDLDRALSALGFRPSARRPSFVPLPAHTVYYLTLEDGSSMVEVDVHVGMHWPAEYEKRTRFRASDLWEHAFPELLEGIPIWAMRPEPLVAITLLDLAVNHRFARLIKFRDVMEIITTYPLDWDNLVQCCLRWRVGSYVGPGLRYLRDLDPARRIPDRVIESLTPAYLTMRCFQRSLPVGDLPFHRSRSFSLSNLLFFLLADTPLERLRGLLHVPRHLLRGCKRF